MPTPADSNTTPARRHLAGPRLVVGMCAAHVLSMLGFASFPALLPRFIADWGLSNTGAGWINGIYFGAYMVGVPVLVSLTDRIDPRRIYLVGAALSALASFGFGLFADGFWGGLAVRAVAGIALAGTYMPGLKALTDHVHEGIRPRAVAFYTSSFSIGTALSFLLTGWAVDALGWRWTVGLAGLGPLAALVVVLALAPPAAPHHLTRPQTALLDFRPVLRNRRAFAYVLAYTAHNWELFAFRSWIVAFLVFSQSQQAPGALGVGWSASTLAALFTLLGLPSSVLGNELTQRVGRRPLVIAIMGVSGAIGCILGFLAPIPFALLVALVVVYGITVTGDSASITAGAVTNAAPGQRGATMAVHSFIGFAGAFVGPLAFGVVLDLAGGGTSLLGWGLAFASAGIAVAMGPLVLLTLGRRAAEDEPASAA
jgi:MFS family permease